MTGLAMRLLTCVAAHDGFNKNGRGCYAGQMTLTLECNTDQKNLWAAKEFLVSRIYLVEEPDPKDGRKRILRVVYDDEYLRLIDRQSSEKLDGVETVENRGVLRSEGPEKPPQPLDAKGSGERNILERKKNSAEAVSFLEGKDSAEADIPFPLENPWRTSRALLPDYRPAGKKREPLIISTALRDSVMGKKRE